MSAHRTDWILEAFAGKLPRYLCCPSLARFVPEIAGCHSDAWLAALAPGMRIGLHLHIPFCEQLCWFCSCRTQRAVSATQVTTYVEALASEMARVAARLPVDVRVARIHVAGGSPMILTPPDIARLGREIRARFDVTPDAEFTVDIDARRGEHPAIEAYAAAGMNRATIFVQDFDARVQAEIGRVQAAAEVRRMVGSLRAAGVRSLGIDMLYGLPLQGAREVQATAETLCAMAPDRAAILGYAHVPWLAKRQSMIDAARLPGAAQRFEQYRIASGIFRDAGYVAVGPDHVARPADPLAQHAAAGRLRRRHLAYTDAGIAAVIGLGAAAVSSFPQGRVQNRAVTRDYAACAIAGVPAAQSGWRFSLEDRVRGRAIEMLMCGFRVDFAELRREFGDFAAILRPDLHAAAVRFGDAVRCDGEGIEILRDAALLARPVAHLLNAR